MASERPKYRPSPCPKCRTLNGWKRDKCINPSCDEVFRKKELPFEIVNDVEHGFRDEEGRVVTDGRPLTRASNLSSEDVQRLENLQRNLLQSHS